MVGRALSKTKQNQLKREEDARVMVRAIALYREEQAKPPGVKRMGLRKVCLHIQQEYRRETRKVVELNFNTLRNLVRGRRTIAEVGETKQWLKPEEVEQIIQYIIELGARGFPLSLKRLREHANQICRARMGQKFRAEGVGQRWAEHFVEKHSDRLHSYRARTMDVKRARAVNQHTKDAWFDLVEEILMTGDNGEPIAPECLFGNDESGFQSGEGYSQERVIGEAGQNAQYQQKDGNRENITVLVTICADGTALAPGVIFKGLAYQVRWKQENPANAL